MSRVSKKLEKIGACAEAIEWAKQYKSQQAAWDACERGDWMAWYVGEMIGKRGSKAHRKLVLTVCKCVRPALIHVPKDDSRPRIAIETTEAWARGEPGVTLDDVGKASSAASSSAASSAVYAAVSSAAYASHAATAASYFAASFAASFASHATRKKSLAQSANIIRKPFPTPPRRSKQKCDQ